MNPITLFFIHCSDKIIGFGLRGQD